MHERFDAVIHAYRLMGNNYHLLIEMPQANKEIEFYKIRLTLFEDPREGKLHAGICVWGMSGNRDSYRDCASRVPFLNLNDRKKAESLYQERVREYHFQYRKLQ